MKGNIEDCKVVGYAHIESVRIVVKILLHQTFAMFATM